VKLAVEHRHERRGFVAERVALLAQPVALPPQAHDGGAGTPRHPGRALGRHRAGNPAAAGAYALGVAVHRAPPAALVRPLVHGRPQRAHAVASAVHELEELTKARLHRPSIARPTRGGERSMACG
jgi:hypothetical protein